MNGITRDFKDWKKSLEECSNKPTANTQDVSMISRINDVINKQTTFDSSIWSRQLGHFHRVVVDLEKKCVCCTCELYNFAGQCLHSRLMNLIEFDMKPPEDCMDTNGTNWENIKHHYKASINKVLFEENSSCIFEKSMFKAYTKILPQQDPNHNYN